MTPDSNFALENFQIENAIIQSATLHVERGFFLTSTICIGTGRYGQCLGGYVLHLGRDCTHYNTHSSFAGEWVLRVLQVSDADEWGKLPGRAVRIARDHEDRIVGLGHIVADNWFFPEDSFRELRESLDGFNPINGKVGV